MTVTVPTLPPPGTELDGAAAERTAGELDAWAASMASQLVDLESEAQAMGTAAQREDVAAAFALWRAISERTEVWDGAAQFDRRRRAEAVASVWSPVSTDTGEVVGADLVEAMAFLDALVTRLEAELRSQHEQAAAAATGWFQVDEDLAAATHLATRLGQEVRHVAGLSAQVDGASRATAPPPDLAASVHDIRARLAAADTERVALLAQLDGATAIVAALEQREAEVRELAVACRDKVAPAPKLAVPSVSAIGPPPADAAGRPWPVVQADVRAWLRLTERTEAAFDEAARRFRAPLSRRDELRGLLQAFRDKAASAGLAEHEALDPRYAEARQTLWSAPCDLDRAETQVDDYVRTLNTMMHGVN